VRPKVLQLITEGKTKKVWETENPDLVILEFKDDITAFDGAKHDVISGKGAINAAISAKIFEHLNKNGIPTHFVEFVAPRYHVVRRLEMIPLEVVCRNIATGHLVKRLPMIKDGTRLEFPVLEFYLKDDKLHDPLINDHHVVLLKLASWKEIEEMKKITLRVNEVLRTFFEERGLILVDFKLEFGRDRNGKLLVGDELNGDAMRIWDMYTGKILDKDVYRKGYPLDEVLVRYREFYRRVVGADFPGEEVCLAT